MDDKTWLADYLKAYDELLYESYRERRTGEEFAAGCRELKSEMSSKQLIMASIFELMGTFKVLHDDSKHWGDAKRSRQVAWEVALEALMRLEVEQLEKSALN